MLTPAIGDNVALGAPVSGSSAASTYGAGTYAVVTDGDINSRFNSYGSSNLPGLQSITIDLSIQYLLDQVAVWHYSDGRVFYENKTEISSNGTDWITIFDSNVSGTFPESTTGQTIDFTQQYVRYIRNSINGNSTNTGNTWVEIKAFRRTAVTSIPAISVLDFGRLYTVPQAIEAYAGASATVQLGTAKNILSGHSVASKTGQSVVLQSGRITIESLAMQIAAGLHVTLETDQLTFTSHALNAQAGASATIEIGTARTTHQGRLIEPKAGQTIRLESGAATFNERDIQTKAGVYTDIETGNFVMTGLPMFVRSMPTGYLTVSSISIAPDLTASISIAPDLTASISIAPDLTASITIKPN